MLFRALFGRGEKIDPRPVAIPAGMKRPETLEQKMKRMIQHELSQHAVENGQESWEDANDFNVEDEDPTLKPTSFEMASEMMEEFRNETEYGRPRDGGDPERDPPERERAERDGETGTERSGSNQRNRSDGKENDERTPARTRRDERDGTERPDRRNEQSKERGHKDSGTRPRRSEHEDID